MRIQDMEGECEADETNLADVLSKRYEGGVNNFYLGHGEEDRPALEIFVSGDLAFLFYYSREEGSPGIVSSGSVPGLDPDGVTVFYQGRFRERLEILNPEVVTFSDALKAAADFLRSPDLPASIPWLVLQG